MEEGAEVFNNLKDAKANGYKNAQINLDYYRSGPPPHTGEIGRRSFSRPPPHTLETGRRGNVTSPLDVKNSGCFQIFIKMLSSCSIALEMDPYQSIRSIKSTKKEFFSLIKE